MQTYITFLRGINMAGHNSVKMTELTGMFIDMGFSDAETYIQSGNVIFNSGGDLPVADMAEKIEAAILKKFNYEVPVMIRTTGELRKILTANPYLNEEGFDPAKMAAIFLHEEPTADQIIKVKDIHYPPDKFKIAGNEIFIYCPNGFGRTKLYTNFFERKMGVTGTARNWKTINTILNIAEKRLV